MDAASLAGMPGVPGHAAGWFMKFTLSPMVRQLPITSHGVVKEK
jgi:hypothetical protein